MIHMRRAPGGSDVGFSIILAIQIAVIFVVAPLAATGSASADLVEMLRFGLAATTMLVIARHPVVRAAVALAFVASLLATLQWRLGQTAFVIAAIKIVVTIGFDLTVATIVAIAAFGPGKVTVHRILGAVILYLYVALIFAGLYRLTMLVTDDAFTGMASGSRAQFSGLLYFSLGSLTTGSTGEILAVHPMVRSLASLESVIGQLFPATLLARLVMLHAANGTDEKAG
jgi:hypothetical protein